MSNSYGIKGFRKFSLSKRQLNNIKRRSIATGALLIGLGSFALGHDIKKNRDTDALIREGVSSFDTDSTNLTNYTSNNYSEQIEKMLNQDIEDKYEKDINQLSSYLYLVDNYVDSEDAMVAYHCKEELYNHYDDVIDISLNLLKNKIADSEQVDANEIVISVSRDGTVAKFINGDEVNLHGDQLRLANSIADFQGYNMDALQRNNNNTIYNQYLKKLSRVVVDSVKLVNQDNHKDIEDYSMPDFVERIR